MVYDPDDTIAAIGTAAAGAARGMVRVSGPRTVAIVEQCFSAKNGLGPLPLVRVASVLPGQLQLGNCCGRDVPPVDCDLFLWPGQQSYTRQPTAELHTFGSPAVLEMILETLCRCGARAAKPGEFTLRAFLAGRIDLTQAEAVLGVIDARDAQELSGALAQMAGGLSRPLAELREQLLALLAELEAGLDFAEEPIDFITTAELRERLVQAQQTVAEALGQLTNRRQSGDLPRVVLTGQPNAGKSSLFNALLQAAADGTTSTRAIVSHHAGTTRDYVIGRLDLDGVVCELVDTAGEASDLSIDPIGKAAQAAMSAQRERAELLIDCQDLGAEEPATSEQPNGTAIVVFTKADLRKHGGAVQSAASGKSIACSSVTGDGLPALWQLIRAALVDRPDGESGAVAATAARCRESLEGAEDALGRCLELIDRRGGEELLAAEIRESLDQLGQLVGAVYTDDVLDRIFSQFCIGK